MAAKKPPIAIVPLGESVTITLRSKGGGFAVDSVVAGEHPGANTIIISLTEKGTERCFIGNNMSKYLVSIDFSFQYDDRKPIRKSIPLFPGCSMSACQDKLHPVSVTIGRIS
jgi:hypothetical protein